MPAKLKSPLVSLPSPVQAPRSERKLIPAQIPTYLELLRKDHNLTTDVYKLWPKLEQLLLAIQRGMVRGRSHSSPDQAGYLCVAADEIINTLQLFAEQGKLDMEHFFPNRD